MENCKARVHDPHGRRRPWPCRNRAKYGDYCGQHAPGRIEARRKARPPTQFERLCAAEEKSARRRAAARGLTHAARLYLDGANDDLLTGLRDALATMGAAENG